MIIRAINKIKEDIKVIYDNDPAAKNIFEVLFCYPGLQALISHRIAHKLNYWHVPFIPRLISYLTRIITGIEIHPAAAIGNRFFIDHGEGDAPKIDLHVYGGQGQHSVRGSHHPQKGLRKKNAENGQNDAADQCRGHGGMYCAVDDPILLAAQAMGHGDTRAYGQTDEEIYH